MNEASSLGLLQSANYVETGGLATSIRESAMAGELGVDFAIDATHRESGIGLRELMYGETEGRFVVSVKRRNQQEFERIWNKHGMDPARLRDGIWRAGIRHY